MEIYHNGKIYLNDDMAGTAEAMTVEDGVITAVGSDDLILGKASPGDEVVDLKGCLVMPGFVDSHMHLLEYALEKSFVDLTGASDLNDLLSLLRARLPEAEASGMTLNGTGFNQNYWDNPELPTRADLDSVSENVPIIVRRTCHHVTVANSPALRLAGLEDSHRDGILRENDQYILDNALPAPTKDQIKRLIADAALDLASKGITQVQTDDLLVISSELYGKTVLDAYMELDREGLLPVRVYEQCNLPSMERLEAFLGAGYMTGMSTGHFTIGPLKLLGDGALGARSAALKDGYRDDPANHGFLNFSDEELNQLVSAAHKAGMQIAIHGIGDRCIQQIIDACENALREYPRPDHRHGIVHCQITHPEDLRRMADLGMIAYIQPVFLKADQHIVEDRVGPELTASSYHWRAMKDLGIHMSGGSDCPIEPFDTLPNMYYAATCRQPGAEHAWHPEKALRMDEVFRLFTSEGAYASFSENTHGRLVPGYAADFTVIDRDISSLPPESLTEASIIMTFVDGRMIYSK